MENCTNSSNIASNSSNSSHSSSAGMIHPISAGAVTPAGPALANGPASLSSGSYTFSYGTSVNCGKAIAVTCHRVQAFGPNAVATAAASVNCLSPCAGRRTPAFMSADDIAAGKRSSWRELEISGMVRNISPSVWGLRHLTALYINRNSLVHLPAEVCQLTQLQFLDLSNNQLRSVPPELGDLLNLRELYLNHNVLTSLPCELGKLFQLQRLGLKGNPLSASVLSLSEEENGCQALLYTLLDSLPVASSKIPDRPWVIFDQPVSQSSCVFTVMCYNVLCEQYATRQLYGFCPPWALNWGYRKKKIMHEIKNYGADVIALQEVQTDQFYDYFLPRLQSQKYDGIFSPKSRAKTMTESERKYVDGCAIFWRSDKFVLVKEHLIEFNQLAMANAGGCDDMLNRVMTKDNIGLAAMLETREPICANSQRSAAADTRHLRRRLLVCNAHIHWDPEFCDVKLIQSMMLLHEIRQIIEATPGGAQLLICADLNSLPTSGVIEYIQVGRVAANHADFKGLGYMHSLKRLSQAPDTTAHSSADGRTGKAEEASPGRATDFEGTEATVYAHPFRLASAYSDVIMPFTNYTADFKGIIDYIFYSRDSLRVLGVLGPVDVRWMNENRVLACPHPCIPSDHFSLLIELEMSSTPSLETSQLPNGIHSTSPLSHQQ